MVNVYFIQCVLYIYIYNQFCLLPSSLKEENDVLYKVNKYILNTCLNV